MKISKILELMDNNEPWIEMDKVNDWKINGNTPTDLKLEHKEHPSRRLHIS